MAEKNDGLELGLSLSSKRRERERNDGWELGLSLSSRRGEREENDTAGRKKQRLPKQQTAILEETFKKENYVNEEVKIAMAEKLSLTPKQVEVWFQNRRARAKRVEENERLQKEVAELKAMRCPHCSGKLVASTFYQFF